MGIEEEWVTKWGGPEDPLHSFDHNVYLLNMIACFFIAMHRKKSLQILITERVIGILGGNLRKAFSVQVEGRRRIAIASSSELQHLEDYSYHYSRT